MHSNLHLTCTSGSSNGNAPVYAHHPAYCSKSLLFGMFLYQGTQYRSIGALLSRILSRLAPRSILHDVQLSVHSHELHLSAFANFCCVHKKQHLGAGATQMLLQGNRYEDPPQSAATFKQMLQQRYGASCPDFLETSWQDAAVQTHRQHKFLFIYLHSPDHEVCSAPDQLQTVDLRQSKYTSDMSALTCTEHCKRVQARLLHWQLHGLMSNMMFAELLSYNRRCHKLVLCMQDTDQFCRQTLCDPDFVQYVNSTFLCWGGDIRKSDPFIVSCWDLSPCLVGLH